MIEVPDRARPVPGSRALFVVDEGLLEEGSCDRIRQACCEVITGEDVDRVCR